MTAFWDIVPCSLEVDWHFIALMVEASHNSETFVYFSETTQLHTCHPENLKSHEQELFVQVKE
jgi:hypothetical protein